ncbi:MAG: hypothetical protein ACI9YL_000362 [Luteibaculaceae bacterium]|jgi:hypothetical protein
MKKYLFLLSLIVVSSACQKLFSFTYFNMEFNEDVVIKSAVGANLPFNFITPNIETNADSVFESKDRRIKYIEEIVLEELQLTITSPSNGDFSFLQKIKVYIISEGIEETLIAWNVNIPSENQVINLTTTDLDLQEYIKADNFSLRVGVETDEVFTSEYTIYIHTDFFVNLTVFGSVD